MAFLQLLLFAALLWDVQPFPTSTSSSVPVNDRSPSFTHPLSQTDSGNYESATNLPSATSSVSFYTPTRVTDAKQPERRRAHISDFTNPHTGLNPFLDLEEGTSVSTSRTIAESRENFFPPSDTSVVEQPSLRVFDIQISGQPRIPTARHLDPEPDDVPPTPEESLPLPQRDENVQSSGPSTINPWDTFHSDRFQPIEGRVDNWRSFSPLEEGDDKKIDDTDRAGPSWLDFEPVEGDSGGRRTIPVEEDQPRHRQLLPIPTLYPEAEEDDDAFFRRDRYPPESSHDSIPDSEALSPSYNPVLDSSVTRSMSSSSDIPDDVTSPIFSFEDSEDLLGYTSYPEFTTSSTQESAPAASSYTIIIGASIAAVSVVIFGILLAFCTWRQRVKRLAQRVPQFLEDVECNASSESKSGKSATVEKIRPNGLSKQ